MQLVGCEGTRSRRAVRLARSGAEAVRYLRIRMAVRIADDFGAIHAYDDKDGNYRCEAMRRHHTVDKQTFTSLAQVRKWWTLWLRKIAERPEATDASK